MQRAEQVRQAGDICSNTECTTASPLILKHGLMQVLKQISSVIHHGHYAIGGMKGSLIIHVANNDVVTEAPES